MTARELAYNAPGNQGLRIDYASVLQARGWPRAAVDWPPESPETSIT